MKPRRSLLGRCRRRRECEKRQRQYCEQPSAPRKDGRWDHRMFSCRKMMRPRIENSSCRGNKQARSNRLPVIRPPRGWRMAKCVEFIQLASGRRCNAATRVFTRKAIYFDDVIYCHFHRMRVSRTSSSRCSIHRSSTNPHHDNDHGETIAATRAAGKAILRAIRSTIVFEQNA
jgi:hypothetical protein